jgi:hypothetical protein
VGKVITVMNKNDQCPLAVLMNVAIGRLNNLLNSVYAKLLNLKRKSRRDKGAELFHHPILANITFNLST